MYTENECFVIQKFVELTVKCLTKLKKMLKNYQYTDGRSTVHCLQIFIIFIKYGLFKKSLGSSISRPYINILGGNRELSCTEVR